MTEASRRTRLTDAGVRRLRPRDTEYVVWDSRVAGLGVRVRRSGHRSFVWHGRENGAVARITLGSAALKTVDEVRRECLALQNGYGPSGNDQRRECYAIPLFRSFATGEWKTALAERWSESRRGFVDRTLAAQLLPAFGNQRMDGITRPDVERWFDAYSKTAPGAANNTLSLLRQIFNAAVATGHIAVNPTQGIRRNPRAKMTRFLSTEEIERLHRALDRLVGERPSRKPQADIIRLLLLTGCRRGEIVKLKWSEVDGDVLRLAKTKTGPRTVWMSEAAQAIIARQSRTRSAYVFPSRRDPARPCCDELRVWNRARREAQIEDVRLHDLRHTVASQAVARGIPLPAVARMLGHSHPTMTLRYAHVSDRDAEAAAERIGRVITRALEAGEAT